MTTRTKAIIASYVSSIMLLLVVFSKPLHIPDLIQWILLLGVFIPLWLTFQFNKKLKQEKLAPVGSADAAPQPSDDSRKKAKNRLILIMVIGVVVGLCTPLWLPLTGTTSGPIVDLVCGLITALIICIIAGLKLRKL